MLSEMQIYSGVTSMEERELMFLLRTFKGHFSAACKYKM